MNLIQYAQAHNFLMIMNRIAYGTTGDFCRDDLDHYLKDGLVSEYAAQDPIWQELGIEFSNPESIVMRYYPAPFSYDPQPLPRWDFQVRRCKLPPGWTLVRGCECGSNLDVSSFQIMDHDTSRATLTYFSKVDPPKAIEDVMMDLLE